MLNPGQNSSGIVELKILWKKEKKKRSLICFIKKYFFNLYVNIKKKNHSYNSSCTSLSL